MPVAQLDRASDYGSEGREFESLRAHPNAASLLRHSPLAVGRVVDGSAPVAELVDALDSGSSGRKLVEVRVLSGALVEAAAVEAVRVEVHVSRGGAAW